MHPVLLFILPIFHHVAVSKSAMKYQIIFTTKFGEFHIFRSEREVMFIYENKQGHLDRRQQDIWLKQRAALAIDMSMIPLGNT